MEADCLTDNNFNVFLGSEKGVFKGVYFGEEKPRLKNFHSFNVNDKTKEITHLSWADEDGSQQQLLVAYKDRTVKVYNRKLHAYTQGIQLDLDEGSIVGIYCYNSNYLVGVESGKVVLWSFEEDESILEIPTGQHLAKVRQCPFEKSLFATGGKENDLKVWNLEDQNPSVPIFKARNVPHDSLDLRVPVWIQDLTFMPQSHDLVAICSRYGSVRLYDCKANNKSRPVINMNFVDHPLMAISTTRNDRQIIVGSSQGKMGLIDIRNPGKGKVVRHFIGSTGGIRSISAHSNGPHFVSCGLDKYLYLHHLDQSECLKKIYLKSSLNCVVMTDDFVLKDSPVSPVSPEKISSSSPIVWQNISMLAEAGINCGSPSLHSPRKKVKTGK